MAEQYTVLRNMSRAATTEPWGGPLAFPSVSDTPAELRLEHLKLDKQEVRDVGRDPEVAALAPVMPTTLVRPVSDGDAGLGVGEPAAAGVTWGVMAVGADTTARSGAGVTVAVLDTGIDALHPAFAGVSLMEQDFSGDGAPLRSRPMWTWPTAE